jgi:hypothetical protein
VTESILGSDQGAGAEGTSHDADIDAGFNGTDAASTAEGAEGGSTDSHGADINAGFDDDSDGDVTDENGLDLGR